MTGRELFNIISKGGRPPQIPFVPTVYEHCARLIDKSPSVVAASEDLIVQAQLESYKRYRHHLVSVGVDIYNVEFEALGGKLIYFEEGDKLPEPTGPIVECQADLERLKIPNPFEAGRMPIFLNACKRINEEIGDEVSVGGTIVGPFTLAAILRGYENFIMDMICEPEFAIEQMNFAASVGLAYGKAFKDVGVNVAINESWISPPLLSPELYRNVVMPIEKRLIGELKAYGLPSVALISGGNTTAIAGDMVQTGTSLLMADYTTDRLEFKKLCSQNGVILRGSIDSSVVAQGSEDELRRQTEQVIADIGDYNRFIFGCGVLGYDTPPERVMLLSDMVIELSQRG